MSYGLEIRNSSNQIVIDDTLICLHSSSPQVSVGNAPKVVREWKTPDGTGAYVTTVYTHTIACGQNDLVFLNLETDEIAWGGTYSSGSRTFLVNKSSVNYIIAKKPTSVGTYGLAVYNSSGELTYSADENLLSIKAAGELLNTLTNSGANYYSLTQSTSLINFDSYSRGRVDFYLYVISSTQLSQIAMLEPISFLPFLGSTGFPSIYVMAAKVG